MDKKICDRLVRLMVDRTLPQSASDSDQRQTKHQSVIKTASSAISFIVVISLTLVLLNLRIGGDVRKRYGETLGRDSLNLIPAPVTNVKDVICSVRNSFVLKS